MPAGVGHAEVPLVPGTPRLTLERGGKVLAETVGRRQILGPDDLNERNSLVGYHHINRTWAGGTAVGPVVKRLEAEAGTLGPEATVVEEGKVKAVKPAMEKYDGTAKRIDIKQIMAQNEGCVTLPVEGLATATYNVRVIYRNPGPGEARLTFFADGAGLAKNDYPVLHPGLAAADGRRQVRDRLVLLLALQRHARAQAADGCPDSSLAKPDPGRRRLRQRPDRRHRTGQGRAGRPAQGRAVDPARAGADSGRHVHHGLGRGRAGRAAAPRGEGLRLRHGQVRGDQRGVRALRPVAPRVPQRQLLARPRAGGGGLVGGRGQVLQLAFGEGGADAGTMPRRRRTRPKHRTRSSGWPT